VSFFAFPFGFYNVKLVNLANKCSYQKCFVSNQGIITLISLTIPRNSINKIMTFEDIDEILKCSVGTRVKWKFEDIIKYFLKRVLSARFYNFLRKVTLL
jgi:hypothetical protein